MNRTTKNNSPQITPVTATVFQICKPSVITCHYANFSSRGLLLMPASEVVLNGISRKSERLLALFPLLRISFPVWRSFSFSFSISLSLYIYISMSISLSLYLHLCISVSISISTFFLYLSIYLYLPQYFSLNQCLYTFLYISISISLLSLPLSLFDYLFSCFRSPNLSDHLI